MYIVFCFILFLVSFLKFYIYSTYTLKINRVNQLVCTHKKTHLTSKWWSWPVNWFTLHHIVKSLSLVMDHDPWVMLIDKVRHRTVFRLAQTVLSDFISVLVLTSRTLGSVKLLCYFLVCTMECAWNGLRYRSNSVYIFVSVNVCVMIFHSDH